MIKTQKQDRVKNILIFFCVIILSLALIIFLLITGYEEVVIGETPCVDGDIGYTWFGLHGGYTLFLITPLVLGVIYVILLLNKLSREEKE